MNKYVMSRVALSMFLFTAFIGVPGQHQLSAQDEMVANKTFPEIIQLPEGFAPEGIATGHGASFYVGSLAGGTIYKGDLKTGQGEVLVPAEKGKLAVGLNLDKQHNLLFVCCGRNGDARVYDAETGKLKASYTLSTVENKFVNDVIVSKGGAYFTNSAEGVLYKIPLGAEGKLPDEKDVVEIELGDNYKMVEGFNTNGIEATPDGKYLIIVNSSTGKPYTVDPESGAANEIDLGDANVKNGDGILLDGHTLYVVQNRMNKIAEVDLSEDFSSGKIVDTITHDAFAIPTTVAMHGDYLYAVNAKFGTDHEGTPYEVVKVKK